VDNDETSLPGELGVRSEAVDQRPLARRRQRAEGTVVAQDDWGLIEVGVTGHGEVVEVAINTALVDKVETVELAEAVLQAARAAQRRARELRG
jgi:DNA-binding protein YbaB